VTTKPEPADVKAVVLSDGNEYRVEPQSLHVLSPGLFQFVLDGTTACVAGRVDEIQSFAISGKGAHVMATRKAHPGHPGVQRPQPVPPAAPPPAVPKSKAAPLPRYRPPNKRKA
jgi:hypothetical protein